MKRLEDNRYRIVEQRYDRDTEEWQFEPGDRVVCELIDSSEESFLPPSVRTLDDSVAPPRFHLAREHARREPFAAVTWAEAIRPRRLVVGDDAGLYVTGLDGWR